MCDLGYKGFVVQVEMLRLGFPVLGEQPQFLELPYKTIVKPLWNTYPFLINHMNNFRTFLQKPVPPLSNTITS